MSAHMEDIAQAFVLGGLLILAMLGLGLAAALPGVDRWSKRFFMVFFSLLVPCVGASFAELITYGNPAMMLAERVTAFVGSLLPAILIAMPTLYLLHCCKESFRSSRLLRAVLALLAAYFAMLGIAQSTTLFYYYTPDNQIDYGPWYPISIVPLALIMVLNLAGVINRRDKLSGRLFYAFLAFLVPLSVAILIQIGTPVFFLIGLGITISALAMFAIIVTEQVEQHLRLQQETARQRARIAVLQMRPHFIHNTMASIYHLCEQDPKAAQQVTMDFNTYLRKNLKAIVKDDPIPFSEELEHTRAYLAVEQVQFASKLVIEYDTPHTHFHLPPLTLQPLAENAVKHGMSPQTVPLRVSIRTRKTESGSEVIVEDNGAGFDPAVADDPHTTLANIRQRLEMMCNGTLEIGPHKGGGTVVKVTIP